MPVDWSPFVDAVRRNQRFVLTTHVRPDGDGLGSMLALAEVLAALGKNVQMVIASLMPPRYAFLDPQTRVQRFVPPGAGLVRPDVAMVLDTGTWNQLDEFGPWLRQQPCTKLVIDHHQTQDDLGAVRFVDTSAEATGRLVVEAIAALGVPLTASAAQCLFIALAMDTGWFRHANASADSFGLGEKLIRAGARPNQVYDRLFEDNSLARLKLTGLVLGRLEVSCNGAVAHSYVQRTDYEATGAIPPETEDLVNYMRSVSGVEVGLFFMEQPRGGVKVSFRSRELVDVAQIAEQFGGGGHRRASGATLATSLEEARDRVLAAVSVALARTPG